MSEHVVLVDARDRPVGTCEKLQAHKSGLLHRAVSILVFDKQRRLLLQRRAALKYHAGGLWSNTCCTHPRPGESAVDAARRRLREEMGFECNLTEVGSFTYRAALNNNFIEHEYDHVFTGHYDRDPRPDAQEADEWRWADLQTLRDDILERPHLYTPWFRIIVETLLPSLA